MGVERVREVLSGPLTDKYLAERKTAGWRPVLVEWERESGSPPPAPAKTESHEVPYGLRVAGDCRHLEEDPAEQQVLMRMLDLIARDFPLSKVADDLNARGQRMRSGARWSAPAVFELLPRLMEAGPHIVTSENWTERRERLFPAV
jgi:hypothetical protein